MAPRKPEPPPGGGDPMLNEIVVAPGGPVSPVDPQVSHGEATEGSSQQLSTENGNYRPALPRNANARRECASYCEATSARVPAVRREVLNAAIKKAPKNPAEKSGKPDIIENKRELEHDNDGVDVPRKSNKRGFPSSQPWDILSPSKKGGVAKRPRVYCGECIQRKDTRGPDGKKQNAKHKCDACAELTMQADTPAAMQEQPEPGNSQPGHSQPIQEARQEELSSTRGRKKSGKTVLPTRRKQVQVAVPRKPQQERDYSSEPSTEADDLSSPPKPNANKPSANGSGRPKGCLELPREIQGNHRQRIRQPGPEAAGPKPSFFNKRARPAYFDNGAAPADYSMSLFPKDEPAPGYPAKTVNPAFLMSDTFQVSDEFRRGFTYPDPALFEMRGPPTNFDQAVEDLELSNSIEATMASRPTGASSSHDILEVETIGSFPDAVEEASPPAPSDFSSVPTGAGQAHPVQQQPIPIDPMLSAETRHPGLSPSATEPSLSREPRDFSA